MPQFTDYADRQSKQVARRIMVDALKRLQAIDRLSNYSYIGFGSYQFIDFEMVHRQLGITKMISIEGDEELLARCHFNAPYRGIEIVQGRSATVIPALDYSGRCIIWLDYTQRLRSDEMADCENLALRLQPGSVLAVTLNCHPGAEGTRRSELASAVGSQNVPIGMTESKLGDWGLAGTQRDLVTALLHRVLSGRGDGAMWQQILNICYRDDARMQMIVGLIDHPAIHEPIQACRFEDMPEISFDSEATIVELPRLTIRERQALDKKLPAKTLKEFAGIPPNYLAAYARFYRWLDAVE